MADSSDSQCLVPIMPVCRRSY